VIEEIQNGIIEALEGIPGVRGRVEGWQGDIEDLLKVPQKLPALAVIYQGADFGEKKTIGSNAAPHRMEFLVVLAARSMRSREAGSVTAYGIIEGVRTALIGRSIAPWGWLWPVGEDLVLADGGLLVYGLKYRMDTEVSG
jgi:hypothetical protein